MPRPDTCTVYTLSIGAANVDPDQMPHSVACVDPDQMPNSMASDLGIHFLPPIQQFLFKHTKCINGSL